MGDMSENNQPRYGAMSSPDNPGVLNGQEYYAPAPNAGQVPAGSSPLSGASDGAPSQTPDPFAGTQPVQQPLGTGFPQHSPAFSPIGGGVPEPRSNAKMPSFGGPIATLVIGIVLMLVVAPTVFIVMMVHYAFDMADAFTNDRLENMQVVAPGKAFTVAGTDNTVLLLKESGQWQCTVQSKAGKRYAVAEDMSNENDDQVDVMGLGWVGSVDLPKGTYTAQCYGANGKTPSEIGIVDETSYLGVIMPVLIPFVVSTVIGIAGVAMTVVGTVLLVKRNRKKKQIMGLG